MGFSTSNLATREVTIVHTSAWNHVASDLELLTFSEAAVFIVTITMTTKIIPQYPDFLGTSNPLTLCIIQGVVAVSVLVPNAPKSSSHASPEAEQEVSANTCVPDNTSNYSALAFQQQFYNFNSNYLGKQIWKSQKSAEILEEIR